jgi:integrase
VKTKQQVRIFLLPNAKTILEEYSGDKPFESLHPQLSNRRLKAIAKKAGLNRLINITTFKGSERIDKISPLHELISFHDARRSFATILTAANFNPDLIKAMTGHRTQREFEKYIKFSDAQINELTNKFSLNFN